MYQFRISLTYKSSTSPLWSIVSFDRVFNQQRKIIQHPTSTTISRSFCRTNNGFQSMTRVLRAFCLIVLIVLFPPQGQYAIWFLHAVNLWPCLNSNNYVSLGEGVTNYAVKYFWVRKCLFLFSTAAAGERTTLACRGSSSCSAHPLSLHPPSLWNGMEIKYIFIYQVRFSFRGVL